MQVPVPRLKPLKLRKLPPEEEIPAIHKMNRLAMNRRAVNGLCGFLFEEELQESGANFLRSTACFRKFQSVLQHTIAQGAMKDLEMKKLYYSISEVSKMVDLEQYVLRYWEREFSQLRPQKNRAGNRIYTEKDIEIIKLIKRLTREDRYTISGARQELEQLTFDNGMPVLPEDFAAAPGELEGIGTLAEDLKEIRSTLVKLLDKLRNGSSD